MKGIIAFVALLAPVCCFRVERADPEKWMERRVPRACAQLDKLWTHRYLNTTRVVAVQQYVECVKHWQDYRSAWEALARFERLSAWMLTQERDVGRRRDLAMQDDAARAYAAAERARLRRLFPFASRFGELTQSKWLRYVALTLCLGVAMYAMTHCGHRLGWVAHMAIWLVAQWYCDLLMGCIHMALDSPATLHLPAFGNVAEWIQTHHGGTHFDNVPLLQYAFQYGSEVVLVMHTVPLLVALLAARTAPVQPWLWQVSWVWGAHMSFLALFAHFAHRFAHGDPRKVPRFAQLLQGGGLLVSREHHQQHHRMFNTDKDLVWTTTVWDADRWRWSFYNGWADSALDAISRCIHYSDVRIFYVGFVLVPLLPSCVFVLGIVAGAFTLWWYHRYIFLFTAWQTPMALASAAAVLLLRWRAGGVVEVARELRGVAHDIALPFAVCADALALSPSLLFQRLIIALTNVTTYAYAYGPLCSVVLRAFWEPAFMLWRYTLMLFHGRLGVSTVPALVAGCARVPRDSAGRSAHRPWPWLHAHILWMVMRENADIRAEYIPDWLQKCPELLLVELVFLEIDSLWGGAWNALLTWLGLVDERRWGWLAVTLMVARSLGRSTAWHATFAVNSVCHDQTAKPSASGCHSRDVPWLSLATCGEAWHINHHTSGSATRHAPPGRVDIGFCVIRACQWAGVFSDKTDKTSKTGG
eukprot:g7252.t1